MSSSKLPNPILYNPDKHVHLIPQLARIHGDCITTDGTLATFLPPLSTSKIIDFWTSYAASCSSSTDTTTGRLIVLQLSSSSTPSGTDQNDEVLGYVSLSMPETETGPFRSEVLKLLVSPTARKMGVARRVMGALESDARNRGRELLMLDTTIGSPAEHVYPKLGYTQVGVIPKYGIHPLTGELVDEVFFYKDLRETEVCWRPEI
ncbi:acyl-CoA N-acyltransferase [Polychaeton citri CBS 116435]|uniref:Acyl-CoA N-acyltransferase n=1 Tax=Polychaeton citri CBS 116435 TaxID=1314669 RepID=A0A9P4UQA6_9PEZI|nr:acyl-CoA N-acyltransferase [Polychaeton citri CBS 116435]